MNQHKFPILLSFYAISNQDVTLTFGQITYTRIRDLTFQDYSRQKTFKTLFRLYRTRPYSNQRIELVFDTGSVAASTNSYGAFYEKVPVSMPGAVLRSVKMSSGEEVTIMPGLYLDAVQTIGADTIIVSDIDDTLLHSFIYKKLRKLRTLMFTTMEKRKAVVNMQALIRNFTNDGAAPVYLSNSEQNLYPMIYRFLRHNDFPPGPLFLKQLRSLWDVVWNVKFPLKNTHKVSTLEELMRLFPEKKFILMGDNTQHDLDIYLSIAERYASNIRCIIIRKVIEKKDSEAVRVATEKLVGKHVNLYYSDNFPGDFRL